MVNLPIPLPVAEQAIRIQIPAIGVDSPVVQGNSWEQLKKGAGQVVEPTAVQVMAQTPDARVTLISCHPYLIDDHRIVVSAGLQSPYRVTNMPKQAGPSRPVTTLTCARTKPQRIVALT